MMRKGILGLAVVAIIFGIWFSTTNLSKFLTGYAIFKVGQMTKEEPQPVPPAEDEPTEPVDSPYPLKPEKGDLMGELYIPKLEATLPIYHGTDEDELERGVGHFANSVLPGEEDNSVLSGHRDTVFRELGEVGVGDLLIVETATGTHTYRVRKVRIVDEDDRTVIVPKPRATLTVSTCYPFDFIGSAPERYILEATLIKEKDENENENS